MKISPLNFVSNSVINVKKDNVSFKNNLAVTQGLKNDVFVKSNQLSFKRMQNENTDKIDINDTIIGSSDAGAAFLIPLIIATAIAKKQNPDEIFLSDGTYSGRTSEMYVDINKASELGFELSPERFHCPYCFCDEINGVYKDFKNGIDINLKEGKYVDLNKGVYVNPEDQTSVIYIKGDAVPVIIPSFNGKFGLNGSGVSLYDSNDPLSLENTSNTPFEYDSQEKENKYNERFERPFIWSERDKNIAHHREQKPQQSFYKRAKNFFKEQQSQDFFPIDLYDIWGREIITLQDKTGQTHYVALTDELNDLMYKQHVSYETAQDFLESAAEHSIQNYIKENYANYLNSLNFENPSMENFLEDIQHNDRDYSRDLPQTHTNTSDEIQEDYQQDETVNDFHWFDDDIL